MVDEYIGQTYGPAGMGMSAYSNIPDPIFSEPLTVSELGQTYGPAGMGMSAYMDRPGPMEMAAPPDNIGYDRMGPDAEPGILQMMPKGGRFDPTYRGLEITVPLPVTNLPVVNAGLPFNLFQDPTADGGIIDFFSRKLFGDDDPENDFSNPSLPPNDGFEPYDPNNPNMFMLPEGMELDDMPIEDILEMMQGEKLEASADSYSLPNLLQMLNDAKDAGDDSYDTILEDIELRYPGATMDVAELTDAQKNFMLSPLQNPNFQSREDLFNKVKQMEDKGFFGFGAQEPTTMEEMLEFMNTDAYRRAFS